MIYKGNQLNGTYMMEQPPEVLYEKNCFFFLILQNLQENTHVVSPF